MAAPSSDESSPALRIDGDLTFATVADVHSHILRAVAEDAAGCLIELGDLGAIDAAGLQLLTLLRRGWKGCPDGLVVLGAARERFDRMAEYLGLAEWSADE